MVVVGHHAARLELVDEAVLLVELPVKVLAVFLIPMAVKPDAAYRTIVGKNLRELLFHKLQVAVVVFLVAGTACAHGAPSLGIVQTVPLGVRVIHMQLHAVLLAGVG